MTNRDDHYFKLAEKWAATLPANDPRRESTVVTRPNSEASRAFLDAFARQVDILNRIERL